MSAKFHTVTKTERTKEARDAWLAGYREDDREKGREAEKLYDDAADMLQKFVDEKAE
jgi:5-methyltetrahydrofolate--homocysteine methyltransferase